MSAAKAMPVSSTMTPDRTVCNVNCRPCFFSNATSDNLSSGLRVLSAEVSDDADVSCGAQR